MSSNKKLNMMSNFGNILILTLLLQFQSALTLVVVKSLEPLESPDPIWGLKLIPESVDIRSTSFIKGITFCGRFYYRRFPSQPYMPLVKMGPQVKKSFFPAILVP